MPSDRLPEQPFDAPVGHAGWWGRLCARDPPVVAHPDGECLSDAMASIGKEPHQCRTAPLQV